MSHTQIDSAQQRPRAPIEVRLMPSETTPQKSSKMDQFISLAKAVSWPVVVLVLYFQLRVPITKLFEELPKALSQSSKLTIGSLSVDIQRSVALSDSHLAEKLKGLSEGDIQELLDLYPNGWGWVGSSDDKTHYYFTKEDKIDRWKKLEKLGLVTFTMAPDAFLKEIEHYPWTNRTAEERVLKAPTKAQIAFISDQVTRLSPNGEKVIKATLELSIRAIAEQSKTP
jgi:hypothetical protein